LDSFRYPLATSTWDHSEIDAMHGVIDSRQFTMGQRVKQFENEFAEKFGSRHGVMSNSGSSANLLALGAVKYSSRWENSNRKEVIVPAVSWSTSYYPVSQMGYSLKFVDIDLETLNSPFSKIQSATNRNTAGILIVNLLGNPAELSKISEFAKGNNLFLVEDNCESLGAELDGQKTGTFGDIGTFSSFFSHHISTMEGGMCLTDNLELGQVMTSLRAHGWTRELPTNNFVYPKTGDKFEDYYRFVLPGYNLRPLEIEAAIGTQQLQKVDGIVEGRRRNYEKFKLLMGRYPEIKIQEENGKSSWFGFSMILTERFEGLRKEFVASLSKHSIEARPIVAGNFTKNPVLRHLNHKPLGPLPNADFLHVNGLFIGNHHYVMEVEFELLDAAISEFYTTYL